MKTALIFGISGQDGSYLAEFLLHKGYKVVGTSRDATTNTFRNLHFLGIFGDVEIFSANPIDFRSVLDVIIKVSPDEIYNLTGQTSVGLSFDQPVESIESIATCNLVLLEVLRFLKSTSKYFNACSSECYGDTATPANEETPFHPKSPYACAKASTFWQTSIYRSAYNLFTCSGILFNHDSPLRPRKFVTQKIIQSACNISMGNCDKLYLGNIDIIRDWGWAPEYVEAMWRILQQDTPEDFVIATGHSCSLKEFLSLTFSKLGLDWHDHVECTNKYFRPYEVYKSLSNPEKAKQKLHWQASKKSGDVIELLLENQLSSHNFNYK